MTISVAFGRSTVASMSSGTIEFSTGFGTDSHLKRAARSSSRSTGTGRPCRGTALGDTLMARLLAALLIGFLLLAQHAGAESVPGPVPTATPAASSAASPTADESHMTPAEIRAAEEAVIKASQNPVGNL